MHQDWFHSIVEILGVVIPLILYQWANRDKAKREQDKRHKENQEKLESLFEERKILVPHDHIEEQGPLQASGIIRRKINGGGK